MLDAGAFLFGTSRRVDGLVDGGFVMAAVPPRLGNVQARLENRWVLVSGRFGDTAARSCRATGATGETPGPSDAVAICRSVFVVSSIQPLGAPSTTTADAPAPGEAPVAARRPCGDGGEVTLADLLYTTGDYAGPLTVEFGAGMAPMLMSDLALDCFGDRTLRFTAWVRDPGVVGWEPLFGLEPVWFRSAKSGLFVSVAEEPPPGVTPLVALAVPPALGDLQAKHVGRWVTVTGHFDDAAAATCTAKGVAGHTPSATEAVTICRATFVVTGVSRAGPPGTATDPSVPPVEPADVGEWLALSAALGALLVAWLRDRFHHA
jgi:hypothetical protein